MFRKGTGRLCHGSVLIPNHYSPRRASLSFLCSRKHSPSPKATQLQQQQVGQENNFEKCVFPDDEKKKRSCLYCWLSSGFWGYRLVNWERRSGFYMLILGHPKNKPTPLASLQVPSSLFHGTSKDTASTLNPPCVDSLFLVLVSVMRTYYYFFDFGTTTDNSVCCRMF